MLRTCLSANDAPTGADACAWAEPAEWWASTVEFVGAYRPPLIASTRALSRSGKSSAIDPSER